MMTMRCFVLSASSKRQDRKQVLINGCSFIYDVCIVEKFEFFTTCLPAFLVDFHFVTISALLYRRMQNSFPPFKKIFKG